MEIKRRRFVIGLALLGASLATGWAAHAPARLRLGYQTNTILSGATKVQTFRVISPSQAAEPEPGQKPKILTPEAAKVEGCFVTAIGKEQGPAFASEITRVILDEKTYTSDTLGCIMEPGVVFRVCRGAQTVDVVLCFHCGEMLVITRDANGNQVHSVYTLMAGNSRPEFIRLSKEAFPNDAEIRAL